jgi:hypothetical protein
MTSALSSAASIRSSAFSAAMATSIAFSVSVSSGRAEALLAIGPTQAHSACRGDRLYEA